MVHVAALPGTPRSSLPLTQIIDQACQEAEAYRDAGVLPSSKHACFAHPEEKAQKASLSQRQEEAERSKGYGISLSVDTTKDSAVVPEDGLIIENMHDVPYTVSPGPEVTAALAVVGAAVRQSCPRLALGVQVLSAANRPALAVALAAGLDFIRAEGFVFSHVADEGIINACAGDLLRYRKQIGAENIQIFADIKKKHSLKQDTCPPSQNLPLVVLAEKQSKLQDVDKNCVLAVTMVMLCSAHALTADVSVAQTAEAAQLFLADGVVLTGTATGLPTDPRELQEVKHAVKIPVLIGSGVTLENVRNYLDASALIIGSYFKKEGYWANAVDPDRVKKFMECISTLRE
ncbi:hypothetical protein WISP_53628 [Willisornis vidua]|uniref:Uncharacterized protein n=1 Tax=Willisornis vidua TaxID=1566151 RepID=A0ABQ9DFP1_9PASS|nr:hypothetical protein WISP_53628 [Willisornis vidua]